MGKIVVSEFVSLDGVMEDPSWTLQFGSEEQERFKFDELAAADALLLGRTTYEEFAAVWPGMMELYEGPRREGLREYAGMMNGLPKHVVSTTLEEPLRWNAAPTGDDLAGEVPRLKDKYGGDVIVFGSADLVNALMGYGLIDEYRIMVFPVVVGDGKRLFGDGLDTTRLKLAETKVFGSGVVVLTYRPVEAERSMETE